jgi:predicted enzyme related to lactoylglutathione lyase
MLVTEQGRFCWYELTTSDADGAQAFYSALFGWTIEDSGVPGIDYRVVSHGGGKLGAIMGPFEGAPPPNWRGYVTVDNTDASHAAAAAAGAQTFVPPHDIPNVGRFAVFADPQGADLAILQPLPTWDTPPDLLDTAGGVGWHELSIGDIDAAWGFYEPLFQWHQGDRHDMGPMGEYLLFRPQQLDRDFGGFAGPCGGNAGWLYYFNVAEIEPAAEKVKALGGAVSMVHEVPGGTWIAHCTDPQGAAFALATARY